MGRSLLDEILYQAFGIGGKKKKKGKYKEVILRTYGEPWALRKSDGKIEFYGKKKKRGQ